MTKTFLLEIALCDRGERDTDIRYYHNIDTSIINKETYLASAKMDHFDDLLTRISRLVPVRLPREQPNDESVRKVTLHLQFGDFMERAKALPKALNQYCKGLEVLADAPENETLLEHQQGSHNSTADSPRIADETGHVLSVLALKLGAACGRVLILEAKSLQQTTAREPSGERQRLRAISERLAQSMLFSCLDLVLRLFDGCFMEEYGEPLHGVVEKNDAASETEKEFSTCDVDGCLDASLNGPHGLSQAKARSVLDIFRVRWETPLPSSDREDLDELKDHDNTYTTREKEKSAVKRKLAPVISEVLVNLSNLYFRPDDDDAVIQDGFEEINLDAGCNSHSSAEVMALEICDLARIVDPKAREAVMQSANILRSLHRRADAVCRVWEAILDEFESLQNIPKDEVLEVLSPAEKAESQASSFILLAREQLSLWRSRTDGDASVDLKVHQDGRSADEGIDTHGDVEMSFTLPSEINAGDPRGSFSTKADAKLAIACVLWGTRVYSMKDVARLHRGAQRHLKAVAFDFHCFTDQKTPETAQEESLFSGRDEVRFHTLDPTLHGWWGKASLLGRPELVGYKKVAYLDLDQVITGSLDWLDTYSGNFMLLSTRTLACEMAKDGFNSSVMVWRNDDVHRSCRASERPSQETHVSRVLRELVSLPDPQCFAAVTRYCHRFDHWLEMCLGVGGIKVDFVQDYFGKNVVVDYAGAFRCEKDGLVEDISIVTFPRSPKAEEVIEQFGPWMYDSWKLPNDRSNDEADILEEEDMRG
ncbi:unnamed protein product [Amoebophrya sp. A25]|nr:unnamed protein product [Amoebophrya sp. A25]|eukprot:GSA25T00011321001.1